MRTAVEWYSPLDSILQREVAMPTVEISERLLI